jgi:WD40 repeat protein/energy-coupling factor transporter ATP-binding protein EcfA2
MKKLVILKFDGSFETGFQANLEIANDGLRPYRTVAAKLPKNITIPQLLNSWHDIYCNLYGQYRIKSAGSRRVNIESFNQECTRESINLLSRFNEWLSTPSFRPIVNSLQDLYLNDEIRIIISTSCHELRQLPWHLWDILARFSLVEVALSSPNAERRERVYREKIRILIILGDSSNINVDADRQYLQNFCGENAELVLLNQPSREKLNRCLQDEIGWDMLFFSGHSETKEMEGRIYINSHDSLTMAELRDALQVAIQRRLQIAFFNSCDGLGIAYELEQLYIPQVIVMRKAVPDKVAQEFLKYFLQEFTGGKSLYISVRNARVELQKLESEFPCASWLPVIVQNQTETPPTWQSMGIISFCPYQGLSAFKEDNAEYFFGRESATAGLVAAVNNKPLVAIIGASGSGKSSLVFAGLIPQLRGDAIHNWKILSFRPGKNPFQSLDATLISALDLVEDERLAELELDVNLQRTPTTLENFITYLTPLSSPTSRILLIADQFEEIYTLCTDAEERRIFLDNLLYAVEKSPFFRLLITIRADFLSRALDDYEPFERSLHLYQLESVERMNRDELEAAIILPAKRLGFEFEEGLSNTIINDIQDGDGRLPLLEFTLSQLWKHQYAGNLTHQAYKNIGGVEKALANYAEMVYTELGEGERETAQRVFIQLVQPGEGTEDTRRLATREEVGEENWDLVTRLASERLVVTNLNKLRGGQTVEVVHEALIRHWGRLRGWMQENRKFRIWQQGLIVALQQWVDSNKDDGALLRGTPLAVAEDWLQQRGEEVSKPQRWFIEKSLELRERERKQKERLRRSVIGGLAIGLIAISGFAAVSEIRRTDAEIARLSITAEQFLKAKYREAALIEAIKAVKLSEGNILKSWTTRETRTKAIFTLHELLQIKKTGFQATSMNNNDNVSRKDIPIIDLIDSDVENTRIGNTIFSLDGKIFASISSDNKVQLWDTSSGKEIKTFKGHTDSINSVSFSPDGKTLASASSDNTLKLWDISSGREIKTFKGHTDNVNSVSFSPDGKTLASASSDNTLKLWDISSSREIKTFKGHTDNVNIVSFSPDGKTLASASSDNTLKLWDIINGREIKTFKGHTDSVNSISFSPDGKILASASSDNTLKLWDIIDTGKAITTVTGHTDSVRSVSFSPDGKTFASASWDKTIKLWDINSAREIKTFKGHTEFVWNVSFSPDGKRLVSESSNEVKLWDLINDKEIYLLDPSFIIASENVKTLSKIDIDDLLVRGCRSIRNYLQNNRYVRAEDRRLCDNIKR